ncbi:MAG: diguanylate cyclase [Herbinix sp.]|jgi:GGDEF domain-containing protein|nr:diguanylate cyclase [Herbinix sp.]
MEWNVLKNKKDSHNKSGYVQQDIGLLLLLVGLFTGIMIVVNSPVSMKLEFTIMLLITFVGMLFAAYRIEVTAVICVGVQIMIYTAYKLFLYYNNGILMKPLQYVWIFYPMLAVGAMILFINRTSKLEIENEMLKSQVNKLVLIDPLTGLYNLKSLYLDLQGQIALAARREMDTTLMIISLRYEAELLKVIGKSSLDILKQRIATIVQDILRIEDRVYAIDDRGSLAIILYCNGEGAEVVKRRIKNNLLASDAMPEIIKDKVIKIDLQFGYLQYSPEIFGKDVIGYKQRVENELQYDV